MRILKLVSVLVALAGLTALAILVAPSVYGQRGDTPERRARELTILAGRGAEIGVSIRDVEAAEADRQKVQGGVLIEDVHPDSPAEKAGLKRSDIVVEFDGEHVRSARQFARLVQEAAPGRRVKATIVRDARRSDIEITPGEGRAGMAIYGDVMRDYGREMGRLTERFPFDWNFDFGIQGFGPRGRLGVTVEELTPQLASYFGAKDGVLVSAVSDDTPASRAGLKAGDVITAVNGERIESREDLTRALRDVKDGDVTIAIIRDRKDTTLKAKIELRPRIVRPGRPV